MCLVGIYIPMFWYTRSKWSTQEQPIWCTRSPAFCKKTILVFKADGNYSRNLYSWMMWKTIMLGSQLPWSIYIVPCTLRHVLFHASFLTDLTFLVFFGCKVNHCSKSKRPKVPKRLWKLLHEIRCGSKDGKGMRSSCFRTTCFFTKEPIIEAEWTSHIFQLMMIFCSAQLPDEQRTACRWNWIACISGHLIHWYLGGSTLK